MNIGIISVLALLGTATAADPLLTNNNNNLPTKAEDVPECPVSVPVTSTNVPGVSDDERLEISTAQGKCFRIFRCVDDKPVPYSEYSCKISDIKGDWWGDHFYQNGLPVFVLNWNLGNPYGNKMITRNVIARKEYLELPAPNAAADMTWARYPILSDDGTTSAKFRYVERANTKGGLPPATCNGAESIQVPYQAFYNFYPCKDPKVPEPPKQSPPPPKEAVVDVPDLVAPVEAPAEVPVSAEVPTEVVTEGPMEAPTADVAQPVAPVGDSTAAAVAAAAASAATVAQTTTSGAIASTIGVVGLALVTLVV